MASIATSGTSLVERIVDEHRELATFLKDQGQISYLQSVEAMLSKVLLLSCASYFESRIAGAIIEFTKRVSQSDEALVSLVRTKAIERQYHTYFSWRDGSRSPNPFFGMFGTAMKDSLKTDLKDQELKECSNAFLELGDLRNLLVHENFATFPLEKTSEEVFQLYKRAVKFVEYIEDKLNSTGVQGPSEAKAVKGDLNVNLRLNPT